MFKGMLNNLKTFEQYENDPYSEENWEESEFNKDNLPLRPDGRIDADLIDPRMVGEPRLLDELPKNSLDRLIGRKLVRIENSDADEGARLVFDNGDVLDFGYSYMEGTTLLNEDPVIMENN